MAQSTTNLGKIHVFPSETLYNQFKDIIADNDLALLKDDGAYIVAALLEQNGYVKFNNGLILQWGYVDDASNYSHTVEFSFTIAFAVKSYIIDLIMALKKESGTNFFYALPISVTNTTAKMYYSGYGSGSNNTRGYYWLAIGF